MPELGNLRELLLSLNSGTAPGAGGLRNEYLTALGERMEPDELKLFEEFGMAYASCELPEWFYKIHYTVLFGRDFVNFCPCRLLYINSLYFIDVESVKCRYL